MPVQTSAVSTVFYVENDTGPSLRLQLTESDGTPIDLTTATGATITIAPMRWSYYWSPVNAIVDEAACQIDADQVNNRGYLDWFPQAGDLSPAGLYKYRIQVTWGDGTTQSYPPDTELMLVIRSKIGGN